MSDISQQSPVKNTSSISNVKIQANNIKSTGNMTSETVIVELPTLKVANENTSQTLLSHQKQQQQQQQIPPKQLHSNSAESISYSSAKGNNVESRNILQSGHGHPGGGLPLNSIAANKHIRSISTADPIMEESEDNSSLHMVSKKETRDNGVTVGNSANRKFTNNNVANTITTTSSSNNRSNDNYYNEDDTLEDPLDIELNTKNMLQQNSTQETQKYSSFSDAGTPIQHVGRDTSDNDDRHTITDRVDYVATPLDQTYNLISSNPLSVSHIHLPTSALKNKSSSLLISNNDQRDEQIDDILNNTHVQADLSVAQKVSNKPHKGSKKDSSKRHSASMFSSDTQSVHSLSTLASNSSINMNMNMNMNKQHTSVLSEQNNEGTGLRSSNMIDNTILSLSPKKQLSTHDSTRSFYKDPVSETTKLTSSVSNEIVDLKPNLNLQRANSSNILIGSKIQNSNSKDQPYSDSSKPSEILIKQPLISSGKMDRQSTSQLDSVLSIGDNSTTLNNKQNQKKQTQGMLSSGLQNEMKFLNLGLGLHVNKNDKMAHPKPLSRIPSSIVPTNSTLPSSSTTPQQNTGALDTYMDSAISQTSNIGMLAKSKSNLAVGHKNESNGMITSTASTVNNNKTTGHKESNDHSRTDRVMSQTGETLDLINHARLSVESNKNEMVNTQKNRASGGLGSLNSKSFLNKGSKITLREVPGENDDASSKIAANRTDYFAAKLASATNEKINKYNDNDEDFVYEDLILGKSNDNNANSTVPSTAMSTPAISTPANLSGNVSQGGNNIRMNSSLNQSLHVSHSNMAINGASLSQPLSLVNLNSRLSQTPDVKSDSNFSSATGNNNTSTTGAISNQPSVIIDPTKLMISQQSSRNSLNMTNSQSQEIYHQKTLDVLLSQNGETHDASGYGQDYSNESGTNYVNQQGQYNPQRQPLMGIASKSSAPVLNTHTKSIAANKRIGGNAARHASIGPGPISYRNNSNMNSNSAALPPLASSLNSYAPPESYFSADISENLSPRRKSGYNFKKQVSKNPMTEDLHNGSFEQTGLTEQYGSLANKQSGIFENYGVKKSAALQQVSNGQSHSTNNIPQQPQLRTTASRMFGKHSSASSIKRHVPKNVNLEDYIDELQDTEYDIQSNSNFNGNDSTFGTHGASYIANNNNNNNHHSQYFNSMTPSGSAIGGSNTNPQGKPNWSRASSKQVIDPKQYGFEKHEFRNNGSIHDDIRSSAHGLCTDDVDEEEDDEDFDTKSDFFYNANRRKQKNSRYLSGKSLHSLHESQNYGDNDLEPPLQSNVFAGRRIFTEDSYKNNDTTIRQPDSDEDEMTYDGEHGMQGDGDEDDDDDVNSFYTINNSLAREQGTLNNPPYMGNGNKRYSKGAAPTLNLDNFSSSHVDDLGEEVSLSGTSRKTRLDQPSFPWTTMYEYSSYGTPMNNPYQNGDVSGRNDDRSPLNLYYTSLNRENDGDFNNNNGNNNNNNRNLNRYGSINGNLPLPGNIKNIKSLNTLQPKYQSDHNSFSPRFSPHNYKRRSNTNNIWFKFKNFIYFTFIVSFLLVLGFISGFLLASNKELQDFEIISMDNILTTSDELLFDIVAMSFNQGLFTIAVNTVDIDIFASSKYILDEPETKYIESNNDQINKNMDREDSDDDIKETILLGTVYNLETPLEFRGGFLNRDYDMSSSSIKLKNPGKIPENKPSKPSEPVSTSTTSTISSAISSAISSTISSTSIITTTLSPSMFNTVSLENTDYTHSHNGNKSDKRMIESDKNKKHGKNGDHANNNDSDGSDDDKDDEDKKYEQWKELIKYEFELIIRGNVYYKIPFMQTQKNINIQQQIVVNPGKQKPNI